jgi:imidazolonepropionase-like amidohydrolase
MVLWALLMPALSAQETFPRNDVADNRDGRYAFTNATLWLDATTKLEQATLLIAKGRIEKVLEGTETPAGYVVRDMTGLTLLPSFIDLASEWGMPDSSRPRENPWQDRVEQIQPANPGPFNANDAILSHQRAVDSLKADSSAAEALRNAGFGTVLSYLKNGIARGSGVVSTLGDENSQLSVLSSQASAHFSLEKGNSKQNFPSSPMGAIALLRQTHYDAQWYARQPMPPFQDESLKAWLANAKLPAIFEVPNWQMLLTMDRVSRELGIKPIFQTRGDEYQRVDAVRKTGAKLIVPLNFPSAPDVEDPHDAERITLTEMQHWEWAPQNPAALERAGISFALTAAGLHKDLSKFKSNLAQAMEKGLTREGAMAALTQRPAEFLGLQGSVGSLKPGLLANFLVCQGHILDKDSILLENWVRGKRHVVKSLPAGFLAGHYLLQVEGKPPLLLDLTGSPLSPKFQLVDMEGKEITHSAKVQDSGISLFFRLGAEQGEPVHLSLWPAEGSAAGGYQGVAKLVDGSQVAAKLSPSDVKPIPKEEGKGEKEDGEKAKEDTPQSAAPAAAEGQGVFVSQPFALTAVPQPNRTLIRQASVWTCGPAGILTDTDVLLENGKIAAIGQNLQADKAVVIEAKGRHLTPGIIDEHSHIALFSVNDTATNSSSVRMADVINAQDVNIYRNLAGGVVAAQLLHGSANPIGGQSAIVKMRWGKTGEEMLIQDGKPFIKFALGENVKRSRSDNSIRYPQTRMGVEQVYLDAFSQAKAYRESWNAYQALPTKARAVAEVPRRDLTLETLAEILHGERFVSCHSYVQSEINMLMKVAERFGFRINTFTHILEGYKVADKMAAHGVGGAGFADWWAYKWEVIYAIPYNATLLTQAGVVAAINSDDAEMARRLNQEAAKSVKYGGMSEEDALKLVTLNPAKLLHLDHRMGSIAVGMDADVVLWSQHPLSIYALVDTTWVDGSAYYDRIRNLAMEKSQAGERARLIGKLLAEKKKGGPTQKPQGPARTFHCEDLGSLWSDEYSLGGSHE